MYAYYLPQWVLFFFIYSFIGWIWENCYVSARKRRWVNRGFMHGPMLPIYGSGALVILVSTLGVREEPWLIFLLGMLAATALEYVTGAVMERIFRVRYWDYSNQKLNLKGYICVSSSLCWGCFSVLLVRVVHVPIETAVLRIPVAVTDGIVLVLAVAAAVDLTQSVNEALDLKRILIQLEESKERIHVRREERREQINVLAAKAEKLIKEELPSKVDGLISETRREELAEIRRNIAQELQKMAAGKDRGFLRAARHLRRNPTAVSRRFKDAFEEIRRFMDMK